MEWTGLTDWSKGGPADCSRFSNYVTWDFKGTDIEGEPRFRFLYLRLPTVAVWSLRYDATRLLATINDSWNQDSINTILVTNINLPLELIKHPQLFMYPG